MSGLNNYTQFQTDMILRDYLAKDRTELANERTLLAYIRTFVGFMASGAALIKLFDQLFFICAGAIMLCISPMFFIFGLVKYTRMRKKLSTLDGDQPRQ
jgi:putative membrane protein